MAKPILINANGRAKITPTGQLRLRELRVKAVLKKINRRAFHKMLFEKPIPIKINNMKERFVVLRHGITNILKGNTKAAPRAVVIVLVDGKKIFFYESSGHHSHQPGKWFPIMGLEYNKNGIVDRIIKSSEHKYTNIRWLTALQWAISENKNKIVFHNDWNEQTFEQIVKTLSHISNHEEIKAEKLR